MIGGIELLVILLIVLVLLFFAPRKLPELSRSLGRAWGEFQLARGASERNLKRLESEPWSGAPTNAEVGNEP